MPCNCNRFGTWNIEGLPLQSGTKLCEIQQWMIHYRIAVLCLQETHRLGSSYFVDNGFLVILPGAEGDQRSYTSVGFLVAPWARHSVQTFTQFSDRQASVKLRVMGGQVVFVSVYAPPNTENHPFESRQELYSQAQSFIASQRCHEPVFVCGDFNARLHYRQCGEESVLGPGVFGNASKILSPTSNRELLLELCNSMDGVLANTMFEHDAESLVTYRNRVRKRMHHLHLNTMPN